MTISKRSLTLFTLFVGGCSQIIGLSDYDVDPQLGGSAAAAGGEGGDGGTPAAGGTKPTAGTATIEAGAPAGGQPPVGQAGQPPLEQGGQPPLGQAGEPGGGQAGQGAGGEPAVVMPCDSAACCTKAGGVARGEELLKDGGFELGNGVDTPWTEEFTKDGADYVDEAITNDTSLGFKPKAGAYYVYLSGIQGERATVYSEDLNIPADAGWLVVSGYRYFQIDKADATNADFSLIAFYDLDGNPLEIPFYWAYSEADGFGSTNGVWKVFSKSWDAAPHQGQVRYLGLRGESDKIPASGSPKASSYLFDDVSLKVFRCYSK
jgi:hypothetical protein